MEDISREYHTCTFNAIRCLQILGGQHRDVRGLLSGCKKQGGWSVSLPGCQHASQTNAEGRYEYDETSQDSNNGKLRNTPEEEDECGPIADQLFLRCVKLSQLSLQSVKLSVVAPAFHFERAIIRIAPGNCSRQLEGETSISSCNSLFNHFLECVRVPHPLTDV